MEILKAFISALVVVLVTSILFFVIYFLFPSLSEDYFGISYQSARENPVATFQSSFMPSQADSSAFSEEEAVAYPVPETAAALEEAAESVADAASDALEEIFSDVPESIEAATDAAEETFDDVLSAVSESVSALTDEFKESVSTLFADKINNLSRSSFASFLSGGTT